MKYVLYFMLTLIFLSIPLSLIGFSIAPSFSDTLSSTSQIFKIGDSKFAKMFSDFLSLSIDSKSYSSSGNCYHYDSSFEKDNVMRSSKQFENVEYLVRFKADLTEVVGYIPAFGKIVPKYGLNEVGKVFLNLYGKAKNTIVPNIGNPLQFVDIYLGFDSSGYLQKVIFVDDVDLPLIGDLFSNKIYSTSDVTGISNTFYTIEMNLCRVDVSYKEFSITRFKNVTKHKYFNIKTSLAGPFTKFYDKYVN